MVVSHFMKCETDTPDINLSSPGATLDLAAARDAARSRESGPSERRMHALGDFGSRPLSHFTKCDSGLFGVQAFGHGVAGRPAEALPQDRPKPGHQQRRSADFPLSFSVPASVGRPSWLSGRVSRSLPPGAEAPAELPPFARRAGSDALRSLATCDPHATDPRLRRTRRR
jgi:hypothetical protein